MGALTIVCAAAARPHPGEQVNGDHWYADERAPLHRFVVIDGLGHGPDAALAAAAVRDAIARTPSFDIVAALERAHEAALSTRGAAVSIAVVDTERRLLRFGGLGNVEARLIDGIRERRLAPTRGIAGAAHRTAHPVELPLPEHWLLLLHSDGITQRFVLEPGSWPPAAVSSAATLRALAEQLLATWARPTDDATVLAVAGRADAPSAPLA